MNFLIRSELIAVHSMSLMDHHYSLAFLMLTFYIGHQRHKDSFSGPNDYSFFLFHLVQESQQCVQLSSFGTLLLQIMTSWSQATLRQKPSAFFMKNS